MGFPSRVYDDVIKEMVKGGKCKTSKPPTVRVFILFSTKVYSTNDVRVAFADSVDHVKRTILTRTTPPSFKFQTWTRRNSLPPLDIVRIQRHSRTTRGHHTTHVFSPLKDRSRQPASLTLVNVSPWIGVPWYRPYVLPRRAGAIHRDLVRV